MWWTTKIVRNFSGAEQIQEKIAKARQRPESSSTRQLRDKVALALRALQAANDPPVLYSRGGILTRLNPDTSELEAVDDSSLLAELSEAADWKKRGKKKDSIVDADPPANVIRAIRGQRELPFAPIEGITRAPFFTCDGELVVRPGFHLWCKGLSFLKLSTCQSAGYRVLSRTFDVRGLGMGEIVAR